MESQKDFAALPAYHGIDLNNRTVRPAGKEVLKVQIGAAGPTGFINLKRIMGRPAGFKGYLSGKVNVSGGKDAGINVMIESLF